MAFQAKFLRGNPNTMKYTPSGNVVAGEVVVLNNTVAVGIAHFDITADDLGALDVGGGVYDVKVAPANTVKLAKVYWDDALNAVTTTSTNNTPFGFIVDEEADGSVAANTVMEVMHWPL